MHTCVPTVLLANEPRAYREVLAMAIEASRPGLAVRVGDPELLEDQIERWQPRLVVCSTLVEAARRYDATWLLLYPDGTRFAVTGRNGREDMVSDFALDDLLALVDSTIAEPDVAMPIASVIDDGDMEAHLVVH